MSDQTSIANPYRPDGTCSRVGLFGGTFDPVHLGHVQVAETVREAFGLTKMILVPAAVPPHKMSKHVTDASDRLDMIRLSFGNKKGYDISDVELKRKGPSYTIDTLRHLSSELGSGEELMMLIGTDAFFELHTWRAFGGIVERVPLIVIVRPHDVKEKRDLPVGETTRYLKEKLDPGYGWDPEGLCFRHRFKKNIYLFYGRPWHISSTDIRQRLKDGCDVNGLIDKKVENYIKKKGLYA